jgi:hypothetical protein
MNLLRVGLGNTAVDLGGGTGLNLPILADHVGPTGRTLNLLYLVFTFSSYVIVIVHRMMHLVLAFLAAVPKERNMKVDGSFREFGERALSSGIAYGGIGNIHQLTDRSERR